MEEEQRELTQEELKEIEKKIENFKKLADQANEAIAEFKDVMQKIKEDELKNQNNDFNPYEERDELEEEAKDVYSNIIFSIQDPLKMSNKEFSREPNVLLTEKFFNRIIVSEEEFVKIYKEAFENN